MVTITVSFSIRSDINYIFECHLFLSIKTWSIWLSVFLSGVKMYLWMLWCGNTVLLTNFFDQAKFTTLTQLSLLLSCKLSFLIVSLKISSLPTFAPKSHNKIFMWYFRNWSDTCSSSLYKLSFIPSLYPQLAMHIQNNIMPKTSKCYIQYPITNKFLPL
jgi:hypothetical protein